MPAPTDKIIPFADIGRLCQGFRTDGKKIVFTNGCFDLLHVGHLRYLYAASQKGDVLIVGVNSDDSVRRLKGSKRPIISEYKRMEMLCGFYCVTHTVLFGEDTPENLIKEIRPDVLTKGADWGIDNIVGADFVRSYGGEVSAVTFVEGEGTSAMIERIVSRGIMADCANDGSERAIADSFLDGQINDPFTHLGLHTKGNGAIIRAFLPDMQSVFPVRPADAKPLPVEIIYAGNGFYTWYSNKPLTVPYGFRCLPNQNKTDKDHTDKAAYIITDPYQFQPPRDEYMIHLWNHGELAEAWKYLGVLPYTIDGTEGFLFRVWAPNARSVSVTGDFNGWHPLRHLMKPDPSSGIWSLFIPALGSYTVYKYCIKSKSGELLYKADPYARLHRHPPETGSFTYREQEVVWTDDDWMAQRAAKQHSQAPVSVYEIHAGSWKKKDGRLMSYYEMETELVPYVKEMGFTHVEFMPLCEHPFDGSWGYQTLGYFAPTVRYGTPEQLKYMINAFHREGIGVILDWVPAHFPADEHGLIRFDGSALYEYEDTRKGFQPEWKSLVFNYERYEVINFLTSSFMFWQKEFHFDGIRVDAVTSMTYLSFARNPGEWEPNRQGGSDNLEALDLLRNINARMKKEVPGAIVVAEESTLRQHITRPVTENGLGFDYTWNLGWMNDTLKYVKYDPMYRGQQHHVITHCADYIYTEQFILPLSHDEVVHCKSALAGKMPGSPEQKIAGLRVYYGFMWTFPGKKLLFMGGEIAQWSEWNYKGESEWHLLSYASHRGVQNLVGALNRLYRATPALYEGDGDPAGFAWIKKDDANESVYAYRRIALTPGTGADVITVCNFSGNFYNLRLGVQEAGKYRILLNTDDRAFGGNSSVNQSDILSEAVSWDNCFHSIIVPVSPLTTVILQKS
ncbi:hypothetical protein CHS0354_006826 [Potamilus streckersoni]|uniref:Glycosyl hydrolase family 13 catalytic domain-containing protein n=1 Tax=Potamilus streckersoni TaxID=2493646 RepID=A0AAE0TF59_9BIVA|nr:hypothetical protein CHS0354_006826 [Potamilus streckersoni]